MDVKGFFTPKKKARTIPKLVKPEDMPENFGFSQAIYDRMEAAMDDNWSTTGKRAVVKLCRVFDDDERKHFWIDDLAADFRLAGWSVSMNKVDPTGISDDDTLIFYNAPPLPPGTKVLRAVRDTRQTGPV